MQKKLVPKNALGFTYGYQNVNVLPLLDSNSVVSSFSPGPVPRPMPPQTILTSTRKKRPQPSLKVAQRPVSATGHWIFPPISKARRTGRGPSIVPNPKPANITRLVRHRIQQATALSRFQQTLGCKVVKLQKPRSLRPSYIQSPMLPCPLATVIRGLTS